MEFKLLPGTDLNVSRISIGTMTFGGQVSEADAVRMVDHCLEVGINFFDTANVYNAGLSEVIAGKALKGRRHKVVLASKVRGKMGDESDESGLSRAAIRRGVEDTLQRLQTDYLDLYYLHQPDWGTPIEETLAAMDELVLAGKVRYPATSNYAAWQIGQMLWVSENHGYTPPRVSQPMYNMLSRGIEQEYLAFCREFGISVIAYNPLAAGLLTGKHRGRDLPQSGTRFDGNKMYMDRFWHSSYFQAVEETAALADRAGVSMVELAFRWLFSQEIVDGVILGATRMEHLKENMRACEAGPLPEEILQGCDEIWQRLRGCTPAYNR